MKKLPTLLDFLFPPRCPFCDGFVAPCEPICGGCARHLPYHRTKSRCLHEESALFCTFPFLYEGRVREKLLALKYHGNSVALPLFVQALAKNLAEEEYDLVVCVGGEKKVPSHLKKITKGVAKEMGIPYDLSVIRRKKGIPLQHTLSQKERLKNVKNAFYLKKADSIKGKRILLLDDIVTTGATLISCSSLLLREGAAFVATAAVAGSTGWEKDCPERKEGK